MLRKDFDEFLFALVGEDASGMPLTLLTVFARLDLDPWEEAAELARLSREHALQRLTSRLDANSNESLSAADTVNMATRLIALLHRAPAAKAALSGSQGAGARPVIAKKSRSAIYWLFGVIFFLVAQWALSSTITSEHFQLPREINAGVVTG